MKFFLDIKFTNFPRSFGAIADSYPNKKWLSVVQSPIGMWAVSKRYSHEISQSRGLYSFLCRCLRTLASLNQVTMFSHRKDGKTSASCGSVNGGLSLAWGANSRIPFQPLFTSSLSLMFTWMFTRFWGWQRVVSKRVVLADVPPERKPETRVHSDVPPERKPEWGYVRMFPRNENQNEGTFAKTTLYETASYLPMIVVIS